MALGVRTAGSQNYDTAVGEVRLAVQPALRGGVDAYVPLADWGVRVDPFVGPLRLSGEARSVDRQAVLRAAGGDRGVLDQAERDLRSAAFDELLRAGLFGVGGAAFAALVTMLALAATGRRGRRRLAAAGGSVLLAAGLVIAGSVWLLTATFDLDAFERPRFYARGAELLQLLDVATAANARAERYQSKIETTLGTFSGLLAQSGAGMEGFPAGGEGRSMLLASDLHSNVLTIDALEKLAGTTRPVFLVGDFAHAGGAGEISLLGPRLRGLGSRAFAVSGNHDSAALMRRFAGAGLSVLTNTGRLNAEGVTDGQPIRGVEGLKVAGFSDPLEWRGRGADDAERIFSFNELPNADAARGAAERALVAWYDGLPEPPDVVLIHQLGLAQHLARTLAARPGAPLLTILTGHDHKQHVERFGNVVVVDAGSIGAGGLLGLGADRVGAAELRFAADAPVLEAVDLLQVDPFSGAAEAQRVIVAGNLCAGDEPECKLSR